MRTLSLENIISYLFAVISAAFSRLSLLLIMIINGKVMPKDEFGLFSILLLASYFISGIVSGGGELWLNAFTKHEDIIHHRFPAVSRQYIRISVGLAFFIFFITLAAPFVLTIQKVNIKAIQFAMIYGVIAGMNESIFAVLRSSNKVKSFFAIRDFLCPILLVIVSLSISEFTAFKFFMIATLVFGGLCATACYFLYAQRHKLPQTKAPFQELIPYTLNLILNTLIFRIFTNIDIIVLAFFLPLSFVGYYRICAQIGVGFQIVQHFTFLTLPWQLSAHNSKASEGKNLRMIRQRQRLLLLSAACALIVGLIFSKQILILIAEKSVATSLIIPFQIVLITRFAEIAWGPLYAVLVSNKKSLHDMLLNSLSLVLWGLVFISATQSHWDVLPASLLAMIISLSFLNIGRYGVLKASHLEKLAYMGLKIPLLIMMITGILGYYMIIKI